MMQLVPPPNLPRIAQDDYPGGKTRRNVRLIIYSAVTVFLTAWFCTMGPIPAVLAIVVAKHVLVAILLMGLGIDRARREAA